MKKQVGFPDVACSGAEEAGSFRISGPEGDATRLNDRGEKARSPIQKECGDYYIDIREEESINRMDVTNSMNGNLLIVISSSVLGKGDDEQGSALMKSFLYTMSRLEAVPQTMIFMNSGVFLACEGSPVLESLQMAEARGTEIIVHSSCLEYYHLQDKVGIGTTGNMYEVSEKIWEAGRVVSL